MKITVKDCLELEAFRPCVIAAGKRSIDNVVKSVSVMDAADIKTALANNGVRDQIVLTSFYAMRDDIRMQVRVVRELAGAGIAALVIFHTSQGLTIADAELLSAAEAKGLPLLVIPEGHGIEYKDVIEQVMDKLLVGGSFENSLINNTIYHLLNFEKHRDFADAIREAAVSNDFQAVLISKDFNPILVVETRHRKTVTEAVRMLQRRNDLQDGSRYSLLDIDGLMAYWGTVDIAGEKYFLLLVDNEDKYSAVEITKLAEIIELAIGMWKYTPERDVKAELIKALMRGNKSLAYSLKDDMDISTPGMVSVFYGQGIDNCEAKSIIDDFEKKNGSEVLTIHENGETYGIVIWPQGPSAQHEQEISGKLACVSLYDDLKGIDKLVRIFHVTGINGIEGAADGFRLVSETWNFVESVFPYKRVFSKYEMVLVSNCINIQVQGGYIKKNFVELLEPFSKEMGENKARQLLDTLETFVLDAGMNSGKTSQFMGIHTNTVQYRLKRINEVLGAEITGNRIVPGLTIALALKRLERVVD